MASPEFGRDGLGMVRGESVEIRTYCIDRRTQVEKMCEAMSGMRKREYCRDSVFGLWRRGRGYGSFSYPRWDNRGRDRVGSKVVPRGLTRGRRSWDGGKWQTRGKGKGRQTGKGWGGGMDTKSALVRILT